MCTRNTKNVGGIIQGNMQLLLNRELGTPRCIARLRYGQDEVLVTNFSDEY